MERIKLSKTEKKVLRMLDAGFTDVPSDIPYDKYALVASSLKKAGLVKCSFLTNGKVCGIRLTKQGKMYLYDNPYLFNPVNWSKWAAITGIVTALISLAVLVIGCVAILK